MRYVYVAGGGTNDAVDRAITQQTGLALISLIGGFRQKDFGLHTTANTAHHIETFKELNMMPVGGKIAIDSGGYSFIVGDKEPKDLPVMIDCYSSYLESERDRFDYIFSLDIPFSIKHEKFNTIESVFAANNSSICSSKFVISNCESLKDKYFFVWHFKMREQFVIWKHLYANHGLGGLVRNHAVGGLVGIKEAARIQFAPFTGISYYVLNEHIQSSFCDAGFRMHFLGVYTRNDRFYITFLEKLFNEYLDDKGGVAMTYDSINPVHTVRMNADVPLYCMLGEEFKIFPSLLEAPEDVLRSVAVDDNHASFMLSEIDRRRKGLRLESSASLSPLNVFSNLELDKFFEMIIDQYDLVGELHAATSHTNLAGRINRIFNDIEERYPEAFSAYMKSSIALSLERTWYWHRWFVGGRNEAKLDLYMAQEIQSIDYPARLR